MNMIAFAALASAASLDAVEPAPAGADNQAQTQSDGGGAPGGERTPSVLSPR